MAKEKKEKSLKSIWEEMEGLYGKDELDGVGEVSTLCSSGSYILDDALGCDGLLSGRLLQIAGKESSGKTMLSLIAIKEWQKLDPKNHAIFIDAEYTFSPEWAIQLGVDVSPERLRVWKLNDGKKVFERLVGVPSKELGRPKVKPGLLDLVKERGGAEESGLGLIVLDSIANIKPPIEAIGAVDKNNMAPMGRFLPPVLRSLVPLLAETGVTFIAINQARNTMSLYGNSETVPGGQCYKHECSVMVHVAKVSGKDSKVLDENEEPIGHTIKFKIDKNKGGSPYRTGEISIEYKKGIVDKHIEICKLGIKYGVIKRPNNKTYVYGDNSWVGKDNFYEMLKEEYEKPNFNLALEILEKAKEARASGVQVSVIEESEDELLEG